MLTKRLFPVSPVHSPLQKNPHKGIESRQNHHTGLCMVTGLQAHHLCTEEVFTDILSPHDHQCLEIRVPCHGEKHRSVNTSSEQSFHTYNLTNTHRGNAFASTFHLCAFGQNTERLYVVGSYLKSFHRKEGVNIWPNKNHSQRPFPKGLYQ